MNYPLRASQRIISSPFYLHPSPTHTKLSNQLISKQHKRTVFFSFYDANSHLQSAELSANAHNVFAFCGINEAFKSVASNLRGHVTEISVCGFTRFFFAHLVKGTIRNLHIFFVLQMC